MAWRNNISSPVRDSSKPEVLLNIALQQLHEKGLTDLEIVLRKTKPDQSYPEDEFYVYLDGPPHDGKEETDDWITEQLERRQKRVLRVRFKRFSESKATRLAKAIQRIRRDIRLGLIPKPWVRCIDIDDLTNNSSPHEDVAKILEAQPP